MIVAALTELRNRQRHAVRIVDADCGCGTLLIAAARHARSLGFTSVEGRGIDRSLSMIGRARAAARRFQDPGVGLTFDLADMVAALADETDLPADIVLCHETRLQCSEIVSAALAAAGKIVIGDAASAPLHRRAHP